MRSAVVLLAIALVGFVAAAPGTTQPDGTVRYDGHSVVRATVRNEQEARVLRMMDLDVWSNDGEVVIGSNDIRVNSNELKTLSDNSIRFSPLIESVQQLIDNERAHMNSSAPGDFYDQYNTFVQVVDYVAALAAAHPNLAKFTPSIGKTLQGRDIPAIVFGSTAANAKKIFFSGGQHAREWIGPATVVYIVEQLLFNYGKVAEVTRILDGVQFVVVPLFNADGYTYTFTNDRLWRKNRRPNTGGSFGVDLNRNWNDHWGGQGSSGVPTSETYRGTAAFSEPESKAVGDYVLATGPFNLAIDWHSYSQLILRPQGWTNAPSPDEAVNKLVGDEIAARIFAVSGLSYTSEPSYQLYYTSGTASDWYYGQAKVKLSYTIELRDTGRYGFQLPPDQIRPTGQENYAAVLYAAGYVLAN